jgi:hypothetical protein
MAQDERAPSGPFTFPKWANTARPLLTVLLGVAGVYGAALLAYGLSPVTLETGYAPVQPVEYSHAMHAGELGMDCRYCHTTAEVAAHAAVPPTATCMNCHALIRAKSEKLALLLEKHAANLPIEWTRVHNLPRFVYFDHGAHVSRGVGCVACHGRVDKMERVYVHAPLSMGWCLDCHRAPEANLRPPEFATKTDWAPPGGDDPVEYGRRLREKNQIKPSTDCSTCHR